MRPTAVRLARIIPRSALQLKKSKVSSPPVPQTKVLQKPTLIDILLKQKIEAGSEWPANIRIEPIVKKKAFLRVEAETRTRWKKLLRET